MVFRRTPLILLLTLISLIGVSIAQAQGICLAPVAPPSDTICQDLDADQICYVGGEVTTFPREEGVSPVFETAGDRLDMADVEAIELRGDAVVFLSFSANLIDGHFLSGVAAGDLRLEFPNTPAINLPLTPNTNANLRAGAGTGYATVGSLSANTPVTALGRNEAGNWYFVRADEDTTGWVFADLVAIDGDPDTLTVLADDAAEAPEGGIALLNVRPLAPDDDCLTNALILGTPDGAGQAELIVNNVHLQIGSILSILMDLSRNIMNNQIVPEAEAIIAELQNGLPPTAELVMRVQTLQGLIRATAFTGLMGGAAIERTLNQALEAAYNRVSVPEGTETIVVLDENLVPIVQPVTLPYNDDAVKSLVEELAPIVSMLDWGSVTPASPPTFEEFESLQNTPPEAQPVVGNWQLVDVDPNATATSGTAAGGASGGCTSYAPIPSLFIPLTISSSEEGIHMSSYSNGEVIPYNAEANAFVLAWPEDNGDYTAVAVQGDGTELIVRTADYEVDSECPFDEGDLMITYTYTYERAPENMPDVQPEDPVSLAELKENLSGVWEYVESAQETLTCASGQVINLREFAGDELALVFSDNFENVASIAYSGAIPQRVSYLTDDSGGIYLRTAVYFPKTLEIAGEVFDAASLGFGSQITVEQVIPGEVEGDTLIISEVYNLLMTYDVQVSDDFSVKSNPLDCPDVIRNTHTYRRVSSEVPAETSGYLNLLAEATDRWVFTSAEPREVLCSGTTIDPVFDLVKLQVEPLADGAKLWLSVPRFNRSFVGWNGKDFVTLTYSAEANALTAEIADGVTLSVIGRDENGYLRLVKESTVAGCEYQAEITMRQQNQTIADDFLPPTEVVDSLLGSWQLVSQEPAVSCGSREDAFQYNFSSLRVQPGQYGEQGLELQSNKFVYYDPELNVFRGQDDNTGGIITIPAEVAGDTLVMTIYGPLYAQMSSGEGQPLATCSSPEDAVITITFRRG